jgi:hypothetical protein
MDGTHGGQVKMKIKYTLPATCFPGTISPICQAVPSCAPFHIDPGQFAREPFFRVCLACGKQVEPVHICDPIVRAKNTTGWDGTGHPPKDFQVPLMEMPEDQVRRVAASGDVFLTMMAGVHQEERHEKTKHCDELGCVCVGFRENVLERHKQEKD